MIRGIRLALLLVAVVLLQTAVWPNLRIAGVAPEIGLVVTVGVAFAAGPTAGAVFGFAAGLALDLFLSTPLGLSALAWSVTGYGVGVIQGAVLRAAWWFPVALTFVAGCFGGLVFCLVGAIVGQDQLWGFAAVRTVLLSALYGAVFAPLVFPIVRFALHDGGPRSSGPLGGQGW